MYKKFSETHSIKSIALIDKTQETSEKFVDAFLSLLKFFLNWFVTNKMLKDLDDAVYLFSSRYKHY